MGEKVLYPSNIVKNYTARISAFTSGGIVIIASRPARDAKQDRVPAAEHARWRLRRRLFATGGVSDRPMGAEHAEATQKFKCNPIRYDAMIASIIRRCRSIAVTGGLLWV